MTQIFMAPKGLLLHRGPQLDSFCYENWTEPKTLTNFFFFFCLFGFTSKLLYFYIGCGLCLVSSLLTSFLLYSC